MRSGKKAVIASILLLALLAGIASAEFGTNVVIVEDVILPGATAEFEIHITNGGEEPSTYTLFTEEYAYITFADEQQENIAPGETGVYELEIVPRSFVQEGSHLVPVVIRDNTGEEVIIEPIIFIRAPGDIVGEYIPSIALSVSAPDEIDPREDILVHVKLRNRNARTYTNEDPITVRLESDIFEKEYQTTLGSVSGGGEKTAEIRIELEPYLEPGTHPINVHILVQGELVSEASTSFRVEGYSTVEMTEFEEKKFFKTVTTYKTRNDGNVQNVAEITYELARIQRPFITSSHNYAIEDIGGKPHVSITKTLQPLEEDTITVTENYRLLVLILILTVLSIIGYFLLRSPVVLEKEAGLAGTPAEGVSQIKVRLFIKNRSSKTMRNLRVIDRISGMADVLKQESLGTVKPTKVVKKKGQGTLLRWDLDQLEPFEERIITYKVKMPLKLIGDVTLPNMKVKYDLPNGRERTAHSNEVSIARKESIV